MPSCTRTAIRHYGRATGRTQSRLLRRRERPSPTRARRRRRSLADRMSEGILLPRIERGTLLAPTELIARLDSAIPQIRAALEGERNEVTIEATLACLLWETLVQTNWCGFYRRIDERTLAVGPYQGTMGC